MADTKLTWVTWKDIAIWTAEFIVTAFIVGYSLYLNQ